MALNIFDGLEKSKTSFVDKYLFLDPEGKSCTAWNSCKFSDFIIYSNLEPYEVIGLKYLQRMSTMKIDLMTRTIIYA